MRLRLCEISLRGALRPEEARGLVWDGSVGTGKAYSLLGQVGFEAARVTGGFKAYAVDFEVLSIADAWNLMDWWADG